MDWEKYESLKERYEAFLSGENESAEEMTDEVLETPYEAPTLAELPDIDVGSKMDAEEVKRNQEAKRQAILREQQNAKEEFKQRGRAVSSRLEDVLEQSRTNSDDREYQ